MVYIKIQLCFRTEMFCWGSGGELEAGFKVRTKLQVHAPTTSDITEKTFQVCPTSP